MKNIGELIRFLGLLFIIRIVVVTCWLLVNIYSYSNINYISDFCNEWVLSVWLGFIYPSPEKYFHLQFVIRLITWLSLLILIVFDPKRNFSHKDTKIRYWAQYIMSIEGFGIFFGFLVALGKFRY